MEQMELDSDETAARCDVVVTDTHFGIHPFYIRRGIHMNISCFVLVGVA
jgi:metallophosphoesterase superfamily enzyme